MDNRYVHTCVTLERWWSFVLCVENICESESDSGIIFGDRERGFDLRFELRFYFDL